MSRKTPFAILGKAYREGWQDECHRQNKKHLLSTVLSFGRENDTLRRDDAFELGRTDAKEYIASR